MIYIELHICLINSWLFFPKAFLSFILLNFYLCGTHFTSFLKIYFICYERIQINSGSLQHKIYKSPPLETGEIISGWGQEMVQQQELSKDCREVSHFDYLAQAAFSVLSFLDWALVKAALERFLLELPSPQLRILNSR